MTSTVRDVERILNYKGIYQTTFNGGCGSNSYNIKSTSWTTFNSGGCGSCRNNIKSTSWITFNSDGCRRNAHNIRNTIFNRGRYERNPHNNRSSMRTSAENILRQWI
jgi:hypothetical protein